MIKAICTTTISPATEATRRFSEIALRDGWLFFIAGDLKTPRETYDDLMRNNDRVFYIDTAQQAKNWPALSEAIGFNCIQRRNLAFVAAYQAGAELIASIDDDNIPFSYWGLGSMVCKEVTVNYYDTDLPAFDPIHAAGYPRLWHRGYPLELLAKRKWEKSCQQITPDIQAGFWNSDPDVDAICRMEHAPLCFFDDEPFPMASSKPSPFNSQNTFLSRSVMPHYFMHLDVGRWDDIVASYYAQAMGFKVVYSSASVSQSRHLHNIMDDFKKEMWGYANSLNLSKLSGARKSGGILDLLTARARNAFMEYQKLVPI